MWRLMSGLNHSKHVLYRAGWEQGLATLPPNTQWQVSRKLAHQFLGPSVMTGYHSFFEAQTRTFVNNLFLAESKGFREDFKL